MKIGQYFLLILLYVFPYSVQAQNKEILEKQIKQILKKNSAHIGIAVIHLEKGDTFSYNGNDHFPMQSVYKFPLAMAILHQVDEQKISLDQKIWIGKEELNPNTWSPLQKIFPEGNISLTVNELIQYTVSKSDNNTCDIMFRLLGGPKEAEKYIHGLGYSKIRIQTTEAEMAQAPDSMPQRNWCEPMEMAKILSDFYVGKHLKETSRSVLMHDMIESQNSSNRIKGLLPDQTIVAHKTGTGNRIVNDVGIVTLPGNKHIVLAVFVSQSNDEFEKIEKQIARISKTVYDFYLHP